MAFLVSDTMKNIFKSPLYLLIFSIIIVLAGDRILFDRDLYADGACHFIQAFFVSEVDFPLKSRILGIALLHIPFSIFSGLGFKDYDFLRFLWKVSYFFPFLLSFIAIRLLDGDKRDFGLATLSLSIVLFYLPNSMFAVGEYTMIFAILPLLLAASMEYLETENFKSNCMICICIIILSSTYEAGGIFGIIFVSTLLLKVAIKKKFKNLHEVILKNASILVSLIGSIFFFYMGIKYMPDWLKANAGAGLKDYLTMVKWGALSDVFIFYQLAIVCIFMGINKFTSETSKNKFVLMMIIFLICIACLLSNHQPRHSYYSKSLFVPIYLIFIYYLLVFNIQINAFLRLFHLVCWPTFLAVSIYIFSQGIQFDSYLASVNRVLIGQQPNSLIKYKDVDFLKSGLGEKYTWSWGHACVSLILNPSNKAMMIGEFDRDYPYPEVKNIINLKTQTEK
jgi:hypothetical protein